MVTWAASPRSYRLLSPENHWSTPCRSLGIGMEQREMQEHTQCGWGSHRVGACLLSAWEEWIGWRVSLSEVNEILESWNPQKEELSLSGAPVLLLFALVSSCSPACLSLWLALWGALDHALTCFLSITCVDTCIWEHKPTSPDTRLARLDYTLIWSKNYGQRP